MRPARWRQDREQEKRECNTALFPPRPAQGPCSTDNIQHDRCREHCYHNRLYKACDGRANCRPVRWERRFCRPLEWRRGRCSSDSEQVRCHHARYSWVGHSPLRLAGFTEGAHGPPPSVDPPPFEHARRLGGPTILLVRPNRPAYNHLLHNETWRIEAATMSALSFVTDDQIAARERRERRIESLSLQRVRAHMDGTQGREIFAAGGVRMRCPGPC
jgi:hypothetical protein